MTVRAPRRILVIDDNSSIHRDFQKILDPEGEDVLDAMDADIFGDDNDGPPSALDGLRFEVSYASQGEEGVEMVAEALQSGRPYQLGFVDMRMPPGWDGVQTIRKIWEIDPAMQCVICTAYSDYSWEGILAELGLSDRLLLLRKPFDPAEVCQLACALTEKWHLARRAHLKLEQLRAMVAEQTSQLAESEARYALAAQGANDGLWEWNLETGQVFYAPRWNAMLGLSGSGPASEPTLASLEHWLGRVHPDDRSQVEAALESLRDGSQGQVGLEHRILHADGQYRWVSCRGAARPGAHGRPVRAAGSQTDVTNRKLAEAQLQFDALHDALTGLPNRTQLERRIEHCIAHCKRRAEFRFAVLFIDLDRFKVVNDSLGHLVGDELLVELARRLSASFRATDLVAATDDGCGVARLGGDEFVVVLEGFKHDEDVLRIARRLLESSQVPLVCGEHAITAGLSVGIAIGSAGYERAQEVLRDADTALYRAKASGRGRYELFRPELHQAAVARFETESELRKAIARRDFVLHYQPIVCLETGRVEYFEALLRWVHPERGMISPGEFIPVAEESGLIVPLGDFVVDEACRQLEEWKAHGLDTSVNVNASGRQLARAEFPEQLRRRVEQAGLPLDALRIEVTETTLMDRSSLVQCQQMANEGVLVYLDDFGTGYSSLSYLAQLPVHALKVDRSFVSRLTTEPTALAITRTILTLASSLQLGVVAEGVESEREAALLLEMGCSLGQGYLWSRPVPAEQAALLLGPASVRLPAE